MIEKGLRAGRDMKGDYSDTGVIARCYTAGGSMELPQPHPALRPLSYELLSPAQFLFHLLVYPAGDSVRFFSCRLEVSSRMPAMASHVGASIALRLSGDGSSLFLPQEWVQEIRRSQHIGALELSVVEGERTPFADRGERHFLVDVVMLSRAGCSRLTKVATASQIGLTGIITLQRGAPLDSLVA